MKFEVKLPQLTCSDDFCSKIQVSIFSKDFYAYMIRVLKLGAVSPSRPSFISSQQYLGHSLFTGIGGFTSAEF
jgi:hypothetical protein